MYLKKFINSDILPLSGSVWISLRPFQAALPCPYLSIYLHAPFSLFPLPYPAIYAIRIAEMQIVKGGFYAPVTYEIDKRVECRAVYIYTSGEGRDLRFGGLKRDLERARIESGRRWWWWGAGGRRVEWMRCFSFITCIES